MLRRPLLLAALHAAALSPIAGPSAALGAGAVRAALPGAVRALLPGASLALVPGAVQALPTDGLRLDRHLGEHMVLQRDRPIEVRGFAAPRVAVEVRLAGHEGRTVSDAEGRFIATLPALPAGGPHELEVLAGDERLLLRDVLVGEVWVCAGQSNMRWMLGQCATAGEALAQADCEELRLMDLTGVGVPNSRPWTDEVLAACTPDAFYRTEGWQRSTADSARTFSAVSWFFGRELQARLGVPVGLIHNAIGGTCTEAYLDPASLEGEPRLGAAEGWLEDARVPEWPRQRGRQNLARWVAEPEGPMPGHPFQPGFLFEAGIRPLSWLQVAGAVWYQGESNATLADMDRAADPALGRLALDTLIDDWRRAFGRPDLPFLMVQLPSMGRAWMEYREVQRQVARREGVELAVTLDLGHPTDVHPRRKREVGTRLAHLALLRVHDTRDELRLSPRVARAERDGEACVLTFDRAPEGLTAPDPAAVHGFELLDQEGSWRPASARLEGSHVLVSSPNAPRPRAVRYAWAPVPAVELMGIGGAPVGPLLEPLEALGRDHR